MMETWLRSKGLRSRVSKRRSSPLWYWRKCRAGDDFMRIMMAEIARKQGAIRWAIYDPDNSSCSRDQSGHSGSAVCPSLVRDGRDIALSLRKMGGFRPPPWDRASRSLQSIAINWEWMVQQGRQHGAGDPVRLDGSSLRYLIGEPRQTLKNLSRFLDHDLNLRSHPEHRSGKTARV